MANQVKKLQLLELFAELDAASIAEKAEQDFQKKAIESLRFSEKLTSLIPLFVSIVWIGAYAISAPHTATLFALISPIVSFMIPLTDRLIDLTGLAPALAPLVVEGFVTLIAALQETERNRLEALPLTEQEIQDAKQGKKRKIKTRYDAYLFWLMALLVSVNVLGGLVAIYETFVNRVDYSSVVTASDALLAAASAFDNPLDMGWFFIAILAGVLIPFIALLTGRVLAEAASGKTTLEVSAGESWRGLARYHALKRAFLNEALKVSTPSNAAKYAERLAFQYCKDELLRLDDGTIIEKARSEDYSTVDARSAGSVATETRQLATGATAHLPANQREIGFIKSEMLATGYAQNFRTDRRDSSDSDSEARQSATGLKLIDAQAAQTYIEQHRSLFESCNRASEYLSILQQAGYTASLRTIQRAIKAMKQ